MQEPRTPTLRIPRRRAKGFSLVEVVLVLGIVAFALIPAIGVLAMAYRSSAEARTNMAKSMVLQSAVAVLQNTERARLQQALGGGGLEMGFGEAGRYLGTNASSSSDLFYRVTATRTPGAPATNIFREDVVLEIAYPPPAFNETNRMPVRLFGYGSRF